MFGGGADRFRRSIHGLLPRRLLIVWQLMDDEKMIVDRIVLFAFKRTPPFSLCCWVAAGKFPTRTIDSDILPSSGSAARYRFCILWKVAFSWREKSLI